MVECMGILSWVEDFSFGNVTNILDETFDPCLVSTVESTWILRFF